MVDTAAAEEQVMAMAEMVMILTVIGVVMLTVAIR